MTSKTKKNISLSIEIFFILLLFTTAIVLGNLFGLGYHQLQHSQILTQLDNYAEYELPSEVFDRNGEKITEFLLIRRKVVSFKELPTHLIQALLVAEDKNFFNHTGMDPYSILRAVIRNLENRKIVEGGSTITQQLSKLLFTDGDKTLYRKAIELYYTLLLEKRYSKNEIFEKYINKIYFGHGVYGAESASRYFFGKSVQNLNISESALLASIPSAPNRFSPFYNQLLSKAKQKIILDKLSERQLITKADAMESLFIFWKDFKNRKAVKLTYSASLDTFDQAPYFSNYVKKIVEHYITNELGLDKNYLYTGGLKIYTTLDLNKQRMATQYLLDQLNHQDKVFQSQKHRLYETLKNNYTDVYNFIGLSNLDSNYFFRRKQSRIELLNQLKDEIALLGVVKDVHALDKIDRLLKDIYKLNRNNLDTKAEGALISIDQSSGHIIAMVGGREYTPYNQFNRAVLAKRQPGSAFKPFVYAAAIASKKYSSNSIIDWKISKNNPIDTDVDEDSYGYSSQPVSLKKAITYSINSAALNLINAIGPRQVIDFASPLLGISNDRLPENISLALGTGELTPLELCRGIAVFANSGKEVVPIAVRKIVNSQGRIIKDFEREQYINEAEHRFTNRPRQLIPEELANTMTDLLQSVVSKGTGINAYCGRPSAGKTGSTQNYRDAWFVGYTPNLTTAVWVGFDKGMSLGYKQFGGSVAAPVWKKFMESAHIDLPYKDFPTFKPNSKYFKGTKTLFPKAQFQDILNRNTEDLNADTAEQDAVPEIEAKLVRSDQQANQTVKASAPGEIEKINQELEKLNYQAEIEINVYGNLKEQTNKKINLARKKRDELLRY